MIEDDLRALTEAIKANTETIKTLGEALKAALAVKVSLAPTPAPAQAVAEPAVLTVPAPVAPAPVAPAPAPAPAPVAPAPAPAPAEAADPIPTNYKDAKTLGLRMAAEGHSDVLKEFLETCGVKKLIDLPHDRYGDYYKYFKDRGLL